jgi:hypothetical protein
MKYSKSFRNSILKKVLPPSNRSVYSVAKEAGISAIKIDCVILLNFYVSQMNIKIRFLKPVITPLL